MVRLGTKWHRSVRLLNFYFGMSRTISISIQWVSCRCRKPAPTPPRPHKVRTALLHPLCQREQAKTSHFFHGIPEQWWSCISYRLPHFKENTLFPSRYSNSKQFVPGTASWKKMRGPITTVWPSIKRAYKVPSSNDKWRYPVKGSLVSSIRACLHVRVRLQAKPAVIRVQPDPQPRENPEFHLCKYPAVHLWNTLLR